MRWLVLIALVGCERAIDPAGVSFGGREFDVGPGGRACLIADGAEVRCLGPGTLIAYDFTGDGVDDLALYTDDRDGFRRCFAFLEIWRNDGTPIETARSETAKWKEGEWTWIDPRDFPGLATAGFEGFMRTQDAAHD